MTYEQYLEQLVATDDRVMVVTAENRGAIRNLPSIIGSRFVDVGIAEQTMIGLCAGMALRGRIPVCHALATFLTLRAFEFIRTDVGIGNLPVKIVGAVAGFLSEANGATHQAIEDVSLMRGIPNMGVFCPSDEAEMIAGLPSVLAAPQPFYIRYNAMKPADSLLLEQRSAFQIGGSETFGDNSNDTDVAILTYGFLLREALVAQEALQKQGVKTRVVYFRTVKPIDTAAILRAAHECSLVVTLEDHFKTGGLYSIVAETLLEHRTTADVQPIALDERWFKPALLQDVLEYEGFTGASLTERIHTRLREQTAMLPKNGTVKHQTI